MKSRLRIGPLGLALLAAGLSGFGMLAGGAAVLASQGRLRGGHPKATQPAELSPTSAPLPSPALSSSAAAPVASAAAAPPGSSGPGLSEPGLSGPPGSPEPKTGSDAFIEVTKVRLDSPPVDAAFSDDEASLFVLCEDSTLRAFASETGLEKKRVRLPGKGTALVRLGPGRIGVLGVAASFPIIDAAAFLSGALEAAFLRKLDVKSAAFAVAIGEPPVIVAASAQGGRVVRLGGSPAAVDGELVFPGQVRGLATMHVDAEPRVVVLLDARPPSEPGALVVFDPAKAPFGGTRAIWSSVTEPRASLSRVSDRLLVFDRATAEVVSFSMDEDPLHAPAGRSPFAAFPWSSERVVVIGTAGEATVASLATREVLSTIALGGLPSAAAITPGGHAILVALGGGPKGPPKPPGKPPASNAEAPSGTTIVLGGEPLAIVATLKTGEGASAVAIGPSGRWAAVSASSGRLVNVLRHP